MKLRLSEVAFTELPCQHQRETENKKQKNKFWILYACVFRVAFGRIISGEMVDPTSGMRTALPTSNHPNLEFEVKPHPAPLASTQSV
jgi:hypothetical protein